MASRGNNLNNNPRNEESTLFKSLTSLFSGPLQNYRRQTVRQMRRKNLDKYADKFDSVSGQSFKKTEYNPFKHMYEDRVMQRNRAERYIDFDEMEHDPIISCLTGDTKVLIPDEGAVSIEQLADRDDNFKVFSWDVKKEKYVVAEGRFAQKTGETETISIKLHGGKEIECTPDHEFVMVNGEKREAQYIEEGDRIMPFTVVNGEDEVELPSSEGISFYIDKTKNGIVEEVSCTNSEKEVYDLNVPEYHNFALKSGIISGNSVIDVYADEITTHSRMEPVLRIHCPNKQIRAVLENLYYDIMNVSFNIFGWARTMCKYGDFFMYLDIDKEYGIQSVLGLPTREVERLEGEDKTNPEYVQFQWNSAGMTFENWQVLHFRNLGNDKWEPYGSSVLDPARRIWRRLVLLEQAVMAYQVVRSPERKVFYIDVGNIPPEDVEQHMEEVATKMKQHEVIDEKTGRVDLQYDPFCFRSDTKLLFCDGSQRRVGDLAESMNEDSDPMYVWSLNDSQEIVPTKLEWVGKTREDAEMLEIELDDGQTITTTKDHRWIKRDGEVVETGELEKGDSLMPFYARKSRKIQGGDFTDWENNPYLDVYHPGREDTDKNTWTTGHRASAEWKYGESHSWPEIIHHENHVKYDNSPTNLKKMHNEEHLKLHADQITEYNKTEEAREISRKVITEYNKSEEGRKNASENMKQLWEDGVFDGMAEKTWQDEEIRQKRIDSMSFETDHGLVHFVADAFETLGHRMRDAKEYEIRRYLNNNEAFQEYLRELNPDFENGHKEKLSKNQLREHLRDKGFDGVEGVRNYMLTNIAPWDQILRFVRENDVDSRKDVIREFDGIGRDEFKRIVENHGLSLDEFDERFLDGGYSENVSETKTCPECGDAFETYCSEDHTFCTQECYWSSLEQDGEIRKCKECGQKFEVEYQSRHEKFCSQDCVNEWKKVDRMTKQCPTCLLEFETTPSKDKKYCSSECMYKRNSPHKIRMKKGTFGGVVDDVPEAQMGIEGSPNNHEIVAIREVEPEDAYGVTVENSTHAVAIAGENAPTFEKETYTKEDVVKSGVFVKNSIEQDYWIPVYGDESATKIDKIEGGDYTGDIEDLRYMQQKLFAALKVPQSYLMKSDDGGEERTTLAQKDMRFARTIQRLQRSMISELEKAGMVHLYTMGFRGEDLVDFELELNNPSRIAELQQLEYWRTKMDVAQMAKDTQFSDQWIAETIFNLSEEEFQKIRRERVTDAKYEARLDKIAEEAGMPEDMGAGGEGMDLGGEGGGLEGVEDMDMGDEEGGGEEDESPLIVGPEGEGGEAGEPPGNRSVDNDDEVKYADGSTYEPESSDSSDIAQRGRNYRSKAGNEKRGKSRRDKIPGLKSFTQNSQGLMEEDKKEFSEEEKELIRTHERSNSFIRELEESGLDEDKEEKKEQEQEEEIEIEMDDEESE